MFNFIFHYMNDLQTQAPPDIYPLPDDINAYVRGHLSCLTSPDLTCPQFVYPFTLEPHVLALEASRRSTLAAHDARHEALLRAREERRVRAQAEALRRIAPGFEPQGAPLVPVKMARTGTENEMGAAQQPGAERQRSVMDDLVDHLAALESVSTAGKNTGGGNAGDIL